MSEFDPEACYLRFELRFKTDAERERIEGAFEFVRDDCHITLVPPDSRVVKQSTVAPAVVEAAVVKQQRVRC